jgi:hypothetical protein
MRHDKSNKALVVLQNANVTSKNDEDPICNNDEKPNRDSSSATTMKTSPVASSTITPTQSGTSQLMSLGSAKKNDNNATIDDDVASHPHPVGSESGCSSSKSPLSGLNMEDHVFEEILKERQVEVFKYSGRCRSIY